MLISITIALIIMIILVIRNLKLYDAGFGDKTDSYFNLQIINMYNNMHNSRDASGNLMLPVQKKFNNYNSYLIVKFVLFIIALLIVHFIDAFAASLICSTCFFLNMLFDWWIYSRRRTYYNNISNMTFKEAYITSYKACICGPIYQTVLYLLLLIY